MVDSKVPTATVFFQDRMDAIWLLTSGVVIHPARDDDDGNVVAAISQQIEQVLAVGLAGHVQVEQDQINRLLSRICS